MERGLRRVHQVDRALAELVVQLKDCDPARPVRALAVARLDDSTSHLFAEQVSQMIKP